MPTHDTSTINPALPSRRWSRPYDITLSDTNTDNNLLRDGRPYKYLQNVGTSGEVVIVWKADSGVLSTIYLAQGAVIEGGYWTHARLTGTDAGVDLRGFVGVEGRE